MSDLISRQDAIDEIKYELEMINSVLDSITLDFNARERLYQRRGEAREILNSIQQLPSAQPEIIHCRECKHWREGDAYSYCDKLFSMGVLDVYDYMASEDDFCSNAERRTDAETEV